MKEVVAEKRTVFFSTHLLDQAERLCNRVGILHRGRLAAVGTLEELKRSADHSLEEIFFSVTQPSPSEDAVPPAPAGSTP
jgi:ABC-2 type transport system ATP-binding protein